MRRSCQQAGVSRSGHGPRTSTRRQKTAARAGSGSSSFMASDARSFGAPLFRSVGGRRPGRRFASIMSTLDPLNGSWPVRIRRASTPTLYQSAAGVTRCDRRLLGCHVRGCPEDHADRNERPRLASGVAAIGRSDARPKSSTTTRPSGVTSTFDGLMSQCTMPAR